MADEGDGGYQLVCDCNSLATRIDEELSAISPDIKTATISADSDTKYQYLVTIMESLNRNGFKNIQINGVSQAN